MSHFKNFLKFFFQNGKALDDIKPLTEYLKTNDQFKNTSLKIHSTKENLKGGLINKIDSLLEEEDEVKLIEDKKNKKQ